MTLGATYIIIILSATKNEVMNLVANKKLGRPTDSPKNFMLRVKMDRETLDKLDECCKIEEVNRSEFVRKSIHEKYDDLKK